MRKRYCSPVAIVLFDLLWVTSGSAVEVMYETQAIDAVVNNNGGGFGYSLTTNGDFLVVGALDENGSDGTYQVGGAHAYTFSGGSWQLFQSFEMPTLEANSNFGISVAVDGDHLVIGAEAADLAYTDSGGVYIYGFDGTDWKWSQTISLSGINTFDLPGNQGISVDIEGDYLIFGAIGADDGTNYSDRDYGAAFVYRKSAGTWNFSTRLEAASPSTREFFGNFVGISGDWIYVHGQETRQSDLFKKRSNGSYPSTPEFTLGQSQNRTMALSNNRIAKIAGDCVEIHEYSETGGWGLSASVCPPLTEAEYPTSLAMEGSRLVIGCQANYGEDETGSAFVYDFENSAWTLTAHLRPSGGDADHEFGATVAFSGDDIFVGAPAWLSFKVGKVYHFKLPNEGDAFSDGGVSEAWQTANGFDPEVDDVFTLDSDGDGDPDIWEIFQGTDRDGAGDRYGFKQTQVDPSSKTLSTQFRRSTLSSATSVVTAVGKWSPDLQNWYYSGETADGVTVTFTENPTDMGDYEIVDVDVSVTSGETPQLFYSLELIPVE